MSSIIMCRRDHIGITSVVKYLVEFPPSNQVNDFEENPNFTFDRLFKKMWSNNSVI